MEKFKPLRFFVPGVPVPGGSKKAFYNKKLGRAMIVPASNKTKPWMQAVAGCVGSEFNGDLLEGALELKFLFRLLRPKSHYGSGKNANQIKDSAPQFPISKPDLTKLVRSTEDALTGVLFRDDSQIVMCRHAKMFVEKDPGVIIEVKRPIC